jgi:predicted nucleotidyltransferase component of viral defense system
MEEPPLFNFLKGEKLEKAKLQDLLIEIIYNYIQPDAVLYGGTAIWRCFGSNRFSEDIDIYVNSNFSKNLKKELERNQLKIVWKNPKIKSWKISNGITEVLLETKIGEPEKIPIQYKKVDGSSITVFSLPPLDLAIRKMEAYSQRLFIRDLYDIMFLTNFLNKDDYYTKTKFKEFLSNIKKPIDEKILSSLILKGYSKFTFRMIVDYLRRWVGEI